MQTQAIQLQQQNKTQTAKTQAATGTSSSGPDFKNMLSREIERAPASTAPEQPAAGTSQNTSQNVPAKVKTPQAAKPSAQPSQAAQANKAQQARDARQAAESNAAAQDAGPAGEAPAPAAMAQAAQTAAADGKADSAATDAAADDATDEAIAAAAADPMANMLAMLAAYNQLTPATRVPAEAAPDDGALADTVADGKGSAAGDAATLAALQAGADKLAGTTARTEAAPKDVPAESRGAATAGDTTALQQLQAKAAAAEGAPAATPDAKVLSTEQKAEAFAAKLAEAASANVQPALPQAAQALAATTQAAQAVATSQLQARVGSNAWEQQLGQKVVWMVAGGDQSASLTLNPPDLGPLQIVLNVSNDSATATFTAHQPETRQAIENALPKLREMMSEAGIQLGDASVSAGSQEQQRAFAEQAKNGGSGSGRAGGPRYGEAGDSAPQDTLQPVVRRTVLGAVDTFA
ncbi:flagellar hook-length control protein FliK [Pseudoduganella lurida]|uniref:Flagellar hook-length control protein FliK n=1 Tax=Pseudoduganella lurida TaxID=1036180 RepID=A0A562R685_9BURK|nr:flagellar hook-length control protein FliK [Pseudoduganella lurida]TWI64592.1 flagellar hook-length control protein FliK [Pseudoduganella lurida]